jgi:hypothetical protein
MGWYFGVVEWMPEEDDGLQSLQSVVEWISVSHRLRYSPEWERVRGAVAGLPAPLRGSFQEGVREGRVALARLLEVCEPG